MTSSTGFVGTDWGLHAHTYTTGVVFTNPSIRIDPSMNRPTLYNTYFWGTFYVRAKHFYHYGEHVLELAINVLIS